MKATFEITKIVIGRRYILLPNSLIITIFNRNEQNYYMLCWVV